MSVLNFVQVSSDVVLIDTRVYCRDIINVDHSDWIQNVLYKHQNVIEKYFGHLRFQNGYVNISNGGKKETKYVLLTEAQCNFCLSLSRNSFEVVIKKAELIQDFENTKKLLREQFERQFNLQPENSREEIEKLKKDIECLAKKSSYRKHLIADLNKELDNLTNQKIELTNKLDLIQSQNSLLTKQNQELSKELETNKKNLHKLKLHRDNYYDQLQTLKSKENLIQEESQTSEFPREFLDVYSQVHYSTKNYLFFNVMVELLKLQESVDYLFIGQKYIKGKLNYSALHISESAFQAILTFGRPKQGIKTNSNTPRKLTVSRSFLNTHQTSKDSANTLQPKVD
jgi:hypothetical protein